MATSIALILALVAAAATTSVLAGGGCCAKKPRELEITIGVRSYKGDWWFTNENKDEEYLSGFKASGKASLDEYIQSLPKNKQPQMRKLKGDKQEYYIINEGNSWVTVRDPNSGERHGYLISSDGYHAVNTENEPNPLEEVPGKNYRTTLFAKTRPMTFDDVYAESKKIGAAQKNGFNQEYKGTHFTIDLVLAIINDEGKKQLQASSANWAPALQLLDAHFNSHLGQSAFVHHDIPLAALPSRASIDQPGGNACASGFEATDA